MTWLMRATVFAGLLWLAGCNGGSSTPDPAPADTLINGTVTIEGAPLADLSDQTASGSQDADKWAVWLIDPTEDVDSIALVNGDDTFVSSDIQQAGDYLLQVKVVPAVDLTGGIETATPVELSIPVSLVEGTTTAAVVDVTFLAPQAVSAVRSVSQTGPEGYRVRLHYSISGADGVNELIELNWRNRLLRRDTNRDGLLSDELDYADSDRDCISDSLYQYLWQKRHGEPYTLGGMITELDLAQDRLRVGETTVLVSEGTRIHQGMKELRLEQLAIGDEVSVSGQRDHEGRVFANTINVTRGARQQPPR
jgi:hypothetical protein